MFAMFKGEPDRPRDGQKGSVPSTAPRKQVAKVTLQVFRLPPLPGIKPEDLPQCIDECLRGMRHHAWHECEYHEGNLTQEGGDCTVSPALFSDIKMCADDKIPRRRMFKLIGGNMVAYNEITRKEVTTIDLRQAIAVIDLNPDQSQRDLKLAAGRKTPGGGGDDEYDGGMGMFGARPRSFRVEFKSGDGIAFSADKDADKSTW
jgi:serine/arginine repetitive matrix protein 2